MRESPMAKQFKKLLPEELQKIAHVSFSNQILWRTAAEHLQTLYGKYAQPQFCLEQYYHSDEYKKNRQIIKQCKDIPEITMEDIQKMLKEEAEYAGTAKELLKLGKMEETPETMERMASLLGIFPDKNDRAMYKYLVAKNAISEEEWPAIREKVRENADLLMLITDVLAKTFLPGYLLDFPMIENVMTQPRSRYYYRGENAYYGHSRASRYRMKGDERLSPDGQEFIARMRRYQCWDTFDRFDAVRRWDFSAINYMALAQHYGFKTEMLDITSDLKTALFFACCKWGPDQKWAPLTKEDFAHRNSRSYISQNCDGDSRYGVLFRSPTELTDISWSEEPEGKMFGSITPIGYQPFMRCSQQHGYMLLTAPGDDLFLDKRFDKFKIRLSEDICNWIYEEMDRGGAVYPNDDIPDISAEIEGINSITVFSRNVFEAAAEDIKMPRKDRDDLAAAFGKLGYEIKDTVTVITPEKLEQINREYPAQKAMQKPGITPQLRPLVTLPKDTEVEVDEE